ncbi:hypothetical protein AB7Y49_12125 [Providencia vermicola]|uniref:MrfJ n=2 Tax=Providencia TaxID=586 RepID=A0ABD5L7M2_PROST|nr:MULTISPECIES: hypothetical protein [Providencia]ELR5046188.1 hypothetical protein [Providencia rettgeri]ELR5122955.1 hypothetical protein [Providencia stuartii]ELR5293258.1 hypothetical protein [Providencia stuartii]ELX8379869.1 hypothetical protein [Providencia stuartii]ELZ5941072.1 hypothetical protein [Providencia stuartii]
MFKIIANFGVGLLLALSSSAMVYASTYFSYVEEVESHSKTENTYHYVIENWKVSSPYEPNPCKTILGSNARGCYFSINHLHAAPSKGGTASRIDWSCSINFINYTSMAAIIRDAQSQCGLAFPKSGKTRHSGPITTEECVGIFVATTDKKGGATMLPGGVCGIVPPPAGKCAFKYINNQQLVLDHGALNPDELNGNQKNSWFSVMCNKDMAIKIMSNMDGDYVNLRPDGSLKSHITLNGSPASAGVVYNMQANMETPVFTESTLITHGEVKPGKFSGRITLVMVVP